MSTLKGNKLLVLGSTELISVIVKKAKELGVYTIVTDNRPIEKAPAKQIADAYFDIDFSDINKIKQLVIEQKIDGVLTGFTDSYMGYYLSICEECGLPCYGNKRSFDVATDKSIFKEACIQSNIPVIPGITANSYDDALEFSSLIGFPLMLKPVDNSGSRGVIKCEKIDDLKCSYEYALSFSTIKQVIIEKYLDCDNIAVSYFIADGEVRLSTTDDRMVYKSPESGSSVSSYSEYPSKYTERYISEVNDNVISMLKANGFKNGMVSLQAFVDENSFYFCEMCYRLSGGQHYFLVENQNKIDQLALLIEFAVTGSCIKNWNADAETPYFTEKYAMLRVIGEPGKVIAKLEGFDTILNNDRVLKAYTSKQVGDTVGKSGTTAQVLGNVLYRFSQSEDSKAIAEDLLGQLKIEDENGHSIAWISID